MAATVLLGSWAAATAARGTLDFTEGMPATVTALLLLVFAYPLVAGELARRERRYVITSERALVLDPRRVEVELELARVEKTALHRALFDDAPTGVELRVADGTAPVVFAEMADPPAVQGAVAAAIEAARGSPPGP